MAIRFYTPEGCTPHTLRVEMSDAETHIAARDSLAWESAALIEFAATTEEGAALPEAGLVFDSAGTDEYGDYARYIAG